jgi:uncharacterized protein YjbI with pentapeptide repeats
MSSGDNLPKDAARPDNQSATAVELPVTAQELPPIAAKATDLNEIKKVVDDAAALSGGLWLSYLFVLFYLAVAAGAVTHIDLFLENAVKLPFLGVELPLFWFFLLAPVILFISYAYTLMQIFLTSGKTKNFDRQLREQLSICKVPLADPERLRLISKALRWQLPNNIFIQLLAGPPDIRRGPFGWALLLIGWVTMVITPIVVFILLQVQFLPFHSIVVTWIQRAFIIGDIGLIFVFWPAILSGRRADKGIRSLNLVAKVSGTALGIFVIIFSCAIATFPGEPQDKFLHRWDGGKYVARLHDWVFQSEVNEGTRHRWLPFSSTLVLSGLNIYEALGIGNPENARWREFVFHARGRDLNGADFEYAVLTKVDFDGALLRGAAFFRSQMQGASFIKTQLQGANFSLSHLQGAIVEQAQLEGASFVGAEGQGADFGNAQLQAARLDGANLQGASFAGAQLQGTTLIDAQLQAADFDVAKLEGSSLVLAQLQGASFAFTVFEATNLLHAFLWRSSGGTPAASPLINTAAKVISVRLIDDAALWSPVFLAHGKVQPWNSASYAGLISEIKSVPSDALRDEVLNRIKRLDCADAGPEQFPCSQPLQVPSETDFWRAALKSGQVDNMSFAKQMSAILKTLICKETDDSTRSILNSLIYTPLGVGSVPAPATTYVTNRLLAAEPETGALVDFIESAECAGSSYLTEEDKSTLLQIKEFPNVIVER